MDAEAVTLIERPGTWSRTDTVLPAEFEALFRAEYGRLVRIAYRVTGERAEAEDVAQDVFISFYRAHSADAPYAAAWLHRAAAHAALNAVRSRRRRTARETQEIQETRETQQIRGLATHPAHGGPDGGVHRDDPERIALEHERAAEVRAALGRMPHAAAALLALRYSGLSYAEVAAATDVKVDQVGTRLRRAHDAFRREVTREQQR